MTEDLRQTIRSILLEELTAQGVCIPAEPGSRAKEELVSIKSDQDLERFVVRLLRIAGDPRARADIESGRHIFRLSTNSGPAQAAPGGNRTRVRGNSSAAVEFNRGLVTEKHIQNLPDGTAVVKIAHGVRLTPLANDAVRQAGIKIEKVKT